jgi:filamin
VGTIIVFRFLPFFFVLVITLDAGTAELDISVQSPNGQILPVTITTKDEDTNMIEFMPYISGHYTMTIMYGDEMITESPLTFAISATGSTSDARASGNGLKIAQRGKESSFIVFCSTSPNVQVERTDEQGERIEPKVKPLGNNEWRISYTVLSVGKYEIRASCPNRGPLPGSPWNISCIDGSKINPVGGWGQLLDEEGRLVLPARIIFDTSQSGPGDLICSIDGKEIAFDKHADGRYRIFLSGEGLTAGQHSFDLTYSGVSVSQSPIAVFFHNLQQAADKVSLTGRGLTSAQVGEPAHFTIGKINFDQLISRKKIHFDLSI